MFIVANFFHAYIPISNNINFTLDKHVKTTATNILNQQINGSIIINKHRKNILDLMKKEPDLLRKDIRRVSKITIGPLVLTHAMLNKYSPEELYKYIAGILENYLASDTPDRLGKFHTAEIIYSLVQSFLAPAQVQAYQNSVDLADPYEWGALQGTSEINISFALCPLQKNSLVVSSKSKKNLIKLSDFEQKKRFISETKIFFELGTGDVQIIYKYSLDNNGKQWIAN